MGLEACGGLLVNLCDPRNLTSAWVQVDAVHSNDLLPVAAAVQPHQARLCILAEGKGGTDADDMPEAARVELRRDLAHTFKSLIFNVEAIERFRTPGSLAEGPPACL